jgi:hypothetical protein
MTTHLQHNSADCGSAGNKYGEYCLLAYCFFVPWIKPIGFSVLGTPVEMGPLDVISVPTVVILARRIGRFRPTWPRIALGLYVLAVLISLLSIQDGHRRFQSLLRAVRMFEIALPFFLASVIEFPRSAPFRLMKAFAVGGGISVILGLVIFVFQVDLGKDVQMYSYGAVILKRAGGIFSDSSAYGHLLVTWGLISFVAMLRVAPKWNIPGSSLIVLLTLGGLYASLSRGAVLNGLAAFLAFPFLSLSRLWRRRVRRQAIIVAGAAVVLPLVVLIMYPKACNHVIELIRSRASDVLLDTFQMPGSVSAGDSGRMEKWVDLIVRFGQQSYTGIGYKTLKSEATFPADNNFLAALVETGPMGFAALGAFFVTVISGLIAASRRYPPAAFLVAVWIGQLAQALTSDVMTFWGTMPALLAITGSVFAVARDADLGRNVVGPRRQT